MTARTLYQIEQDALAVEQLLIEQGTETENPQMEVWLQEVETNLSEKADQYHAVMGRTNDSAKRLKERAQEFSRAARALENFSDRLKQRIKETMLKLNVAEVKGYLTTYKLSPSKGSLVVADFDALRSQAPKYTMQVTEVVADKEQLRRALDAGEKIPGAYIEPGWTLRTVVTKGV